MNNEPQRTRDAWIALRCQLGEPNAFRELVGEFERPFAYFVSKMIGDRDAAWDVLQLVWMRAFRQIRRLEKPEQVRSWLYGIAHGIAVDHLRKKDSVRRIEQEYAELNTEAELEFPFDQDEVAAIHQALDQMDLRLREVLTLHFLEDLTVAEIATIISCPEGTVKSRLYHARQALRRRLNDWKEKNHE